MIEASERVPPAWAIGRTSCLSLSRTVYSLKAVLAAAYKFSDQCAMLVDSDGEDRWVVYLVASEPTRAGRIRDAFINELADQQLRDLLEKEFGDLRTLIVAQAFSEGNLLHPEREVENEGLDSRGTRLRR